MDFVYLTRLVKTEVSYHCVLAVSKVLIASFFKNLLNFETDVSKAWHETIRSLRDLSILLEVYF